LLYFKYFMSFDGNLSTGSIYTVLSACGINMAQDVQGKTELNIDSPIYLRYTVE